MINRLKIMENLGDVEFCLFQFSIILPVTGASGLRAPNRLEDATSKDSKLRFLEVGFKKQNLHGIVIKYSPGVKPSQIIKGCLNERT